MEVFESVEKETLHSERIDEILNHVEAACNDSEKLAGIFLVTKLFKSDKLNSLSLSRIFRAVGPSFLKRLLNSKNDSSAESKENDSNLYRSLGLSILVCLSGDHALALTKDLLNFIPEIVKLLLQLCAFSEPNSTFEVTEDCFKVFLNLVGSSDGAELFFECPSLSQLLKQDIFVIAKCDLIISTITLALGNLKRWCFRHEDFCKLLLTTFSKVANTKDKTTFRLLDRVTNLLAIANTLVDVDGRDLFTRIPDKECTRLCEMLHKVVKETIQSRVPEEVRRNAIFIAHYCIELFGVQCLISSKDNDQGSLLATILALAAVEMRMVTESTESTDGRIDGEILAYLSIAEKVIVFLVTKSDEDDGYTCNSTNLNKTGLGLNDLMLAIMIYFKTQLSQTSIAQSVENTLTVAAYRTICAWLSEETAAMKEEVKDIIPHMTAMAITDFNDFRFSRLDESQDCPPLPAIHRPILLQFLIPVLCHLSADPVMRKIIIQKDLYLVLKKYFDTLTLEFNNCGQKFGYVSEKLETLTGVFLNICVTEPILVRSEESFSDLLQAVLCIVPDIFKTHGLACVGLMGNLTALGLILIRNLQDKHVCEKEEVTIFLKTALCFLLDSCPARPKAHLSSNEHDVYSDLWCVSVSLLKDCMETFKGDKKSILPSNFNELLVSLLSEAKDNKKTIDHDFKMLLDNLNKLCV